MNYKYYGLELTPTIFSELLIQMFDGKQFSRQDAVDTIAKYHAENGGLLNKPSYLKGRNQWECKIGRTEVDPLSRIFSQAGTCYPELPHVALIMYCDDSALLEKALHAILKIKNRWLPDSPGKEWFFTSPQEIENIYSSMVD